MKPSTGCFDAQFIYQWHDIKVYLDQTNIANSTKHMLRLKHVGIMYNPQPIIVLLNYHP